MQIDFLFLSGCEFDCINRSHRVRSVELMVTGQLAFLVSVGNVNFLLKDCMLQ